MNAYTYITKDGFMFKRVDRKTARRCYNANLLIMLCPVNLRPGGPWNPEVIITPDETPFDKMVTEYEFYNIRGKETGPYAAFYIPYKAVDAFTGGPVTAETLHSLEVYDESFIKEMKGDI